MKQSKSSGFTLIELLIVAGLISLLTGMGVASYNYFSERQKVEQCSKELKNNLRVAQSNAINGLKDASTCGTDTLSGWYVDLGTNAFYGRCGANSFSSKTLVDATTCRITPAQIIIFNSINGQTNLNLDLTITVKPGVAETPAYTVVLGEGGEIR